MQDVEIARDEDDRATTEALPDKFCRFCIALPRSRESLSYEMAELRCSRLSSIKITVLILENNETVARRVLDRTQDEPR